jgi:hypothetical protein
MNNPEFWNPKRLIRVLKSDWWHKNLTLDEILIWVPNGTQWDPIDIQRGPIGTQIGPIGTHVKFDYQSALKWIISTSFIFNPLLVEIDIPYQLISGSLYLKQLINK